MDRFDRIFELHKILAGRRTPISRRELQARLGCSRATLTRLISAARNFLNAPIDYDRELNGYRLGTDPDGLYQLPGLWFNSSELFALLASLKLLREAQPGLLGPHLEPLRERLLALIRHRRLGHPEIERRVRILQMAARPTRLEHFQMIATALVQRRRLRILYHGRARDATTERRVSPQRLVYYRDNWYLDAWCHLRRGLRSFALDRIHPVEVLPQGAREIPDGRLDRYYGAAYGIFAGPAPNTAVLRFSPSAARWVADEHWHPAQRSRVLPDGAYELEVPYGNPTELLNDILKHGPEVEVLAPAELRRQVAGRISEAAAVYRTGAPAPADGARTAAAATRRNSVRRAHRTRTAR